MLNIKMKELNREDILKLSGGNCRPSGQTYPAVICDNVERYDPTKNIPPWVQGAVGGAVANARGGPGGMALGALGGAIGGGAFARG